MFKYDKLHRKLIECGYGVRDGSHVSVDKLKKYNVISLGSWYQLKRGESNLSLNTVDQLCRKLHCTPCDILEWEPDNDNDQ